ALAEAEARAALDLDAGIRDQRLRALQPAREVVADVDDARRARLEREHVVEARDAVRLRRRHAQATADVRERAFADPADAPLHRAQRRQEQVALVARLVAAAHGAPRP